MACGARSVNPDFLRTLFREYPPPNEYQLGLYEVKLGEDAINGQKKILIEVIGH